MATDAQGATAAAQGATASAQGMNSAAGRTSPIPPMSLNLTKTNIHSNDTKTNRNVARPSSAIEEFEEPILSNRRTMKKSMSIQKVGAEVK